MTVYTLKEVADILNLHVKTVEKFCREGKIRAFKAGHVWRIKQDALDEFMDQKPIQTITPEQNRKALDQVQNMNHEQ